MLYGKKKMKEAYEWPAKRVRILVRCVVEGSGLGEVTSVAFFTLELSWTLQKV